LGISGILFASALQASRLCHSQCCIDRKMSGFYVLMMP
jgi:hypothetical protein